MSRQTAQETKDIMLRAAAEQILSEGLVLDFANLSLGELIRSTGVSRSTVFRIWDNKQAFVADLVDRIEAEHGRNTDEFESRIEAVAREIISMYPELMDTREGRERVMREVARQGVAVNFQMVFASASWRMRRGLAAVVSTLPGDPGKTRELRDRLRVLEIAFRQPMVRLFERMAELFGRRFIGDVTAMDMTMNSTGIIEGVYERSQYMPEYAQQKRLVPGIDGTLEEWDVSALAVYGAFMAFTEEVSERQPPRTV